MIFAIFENLILNRKYGNTGTPLREIYEAQKILKFLQNSRIHLVKSQRLLLSNSNLREKRIVHLQECLKEINLSIDTLKKEIEEEIECYKHIINTD